MHNYICVAAAICSQLQCTCTVRVRDSNHHPHTTWWGGGETKHHNHVLLQEFPESIILCSVTWDGQSCFIFVCTAVQWRSIQSPCTWPQAAEWEGCKENTLYLISQSSTENFITRVQKTQYVKATLQVYYILRTRCMVLSDLLVLLPTPEFNTSHSVFSNVIIWYDCLVLVYQTTSTSMEYSCASVLNTWIVLFIHRLSLVHYSVQLYDLITCMSRVQRTII